MGWHTPAAMFTVVADGRKPFFGLNLCDQLGLAVTKPQSQNEKQNNNILPHSALKEKPALKFPDLITRNSQSKNHAAKPKFYKKNSTLTSEREMHTH